ncbi:nucleotidyltransferase family protein [Lichenicola sp.]|uniref:nucleotidyltransferase family protein n=1 Tax=Lichenicola sp. TaxID=2804529 RepID=UPI003AFF9612
MSAPLLIGGIVLAAGAGRRAAPFDKLLATDPGGRTMLARTLAEVCGSTLDDVVLVVGHDQDRIRRAIGPAAGPTLLEAPDHAEGIAGSLRAGIAHATRLGWDAALVCLADMPLVGSVLINRLLEACRDATVQADALVPLASGRRGNPVLWNRSMFAELLALRGDTGARALLELSSTHVLSIETGDAAVLEDFDTPERLALFSRGARR